MTSDHAATDYDVRTTAIERGLLARKARGRDAWTVTHPDGRRSAEVTAAELMTALEPPGGGRGAPGSRAPVVVAGENFGDHRECRWSPGVGTRSVAQMWRDLCRVYDSTAPIPVTLHPEVVARLNAGLRDA